MLLTSVPLWLARRPHDLAALLRRTLRRIRTITEQFHLVLHTAPNTLHSSGTLGIGDVGTTTTIGISRFCR